MLACAIRPYFSVIALGFTPLSTLRPSVIEGWDRTFLDVATDLAADTTGRCLILNPVVGPEAITGSTRMKGGSMTKMLLEAVCVTALAGAGVVPVDPRAVPAGVLAGGDGAPAAGLPPRLMCAYRGAVDAVYEQVGARAWMHRRARHWLTRTRARPLPPGASVGRDSGAHGTSRRRVAGATWQRGVHRRGHGRDSGNRGYGGGEHAHCAVLVQHHSPTLPPAQMRQCARRRTARASLTCADL